MLHQPSMGAPPPRAWPRRFASSPQGGIQYGLPPPSIPHSSQLEEPFIAFNIKKPEPWPELGEGRKVADFPVGGRTVLKANQQLGTGFLLGKILNCLLFNAVV